MLTLAAHFQFSWLWFAEGLISVAIYGVLAVSLNLVTGKAGMFSLGHHGFYAVGAYAAAWTVGVWGAFEPGSASSYGCFAVSAAAAIVASCIAALVIGVPCLRLRGDYLAIATLAFGEIVRIVIMNTAALGGSKGLVVPRTILAPAGMAEVARFRWTFLALGATLLVVCLVVVRNLVKSAHGRAIVSLREDEVASELLGVRTTAYKIRAFVIGAAFAGLAGWFYAHFNGVISPEDFPMMVGIKILLIVVLGGLGSLSGSVAAAFVLVSIERLLQTGRFGETAKDWMQVEYALVLILLMLLRPEGIFGRRELSDLWKGRRAKAGRTSP